MTKEKVIETLKEDEEKFHNKYMHKYHLFQKKFKEIQHDGELEIQQLKNTLEEKSTMNHILREQVHLKELQRRKLEEELGHV